MKLKQLRLSRHLSQEQLAQMAGLNVRTIQRIESGQTASLESQKCLAAALDIDINTLNQEVVMLDKHSEAWTSLPLFVKLWFAVNFLNVRPLRRTAVRVEYTCHGFGFVFCALGWFSEAALAGGLILLASAYLYRLLTWQGDKYGIWFDDPGSDQSQT
ncbi:helix-turn-helix domain-containing protein [Aestuariibacter halophilus]|uniref:Helix-turn-helix domain-containing protein n=1 Tax=Fluctibacter halophilus TaxID=226011 RepID=A0ABS8GCH8_9ALTE|nr:helix-turn-helix transcriptional regulator [Aestuariibacter halophilus]MCC2618093.1 helix-turn-helix domain-containing protein [Aestuariibacter halophilus]